MATGLEDDWRRLRLEEEEEVFEVHDEEVEEDMKNQISLCLVGKLFTSNNFNVEALKNTMKNLWKPAKGLVVRELDRQILAFQFFSMTDKLRVLDEGPWSFDDHLLLLKEMDGNEAPSDIKFDTVRLWTKCYDLPPLKRTKSMAHFIASIIGRYVDFDESDPSRMQKTIRFRVDLDISKPLRRGIQLIIGGKTKWYDLKYAKLPEFCYICGKLGHVDKECESYDEDVSPLSYPFGSWMRASPMKIRRRENDAIKAENKLFVELRAGGSGNRVKTKLSLEKEEMDLKHKVCGGSGEKSQSHGMSSHMMIVQQEVFSVATEVAKRKFESFKGGKGEERKARVVEEETVSNAIIRPEAGTAKSQPCLNQ